MILAPAPPKPSDFMGIADQIAGAVGAVFPKLVGIIYFVVLFVVVIRMIKAFWSRQAVPTIELAAIGIMLGMMK